MSAERERVCWCVAGLWGDDVEALCLVKECRELERDDVEALCLVNECRELERDDVEALCLVKECRELERNFGTKFTEKLLKDGGDRVSKRHLKEIFFKSGRVSLLASCAVVDKAPLVAKKLDERWCGMQLSVEEDNQLGDRSYL